MNFKQSNITCFGSRREAACKQGARERAWLMSHEGPMPAAHELWTFSARQHTQSMYPIIGSILEHLEGCAYATQTKESLCSQRMSTWCYHGHPCCSSHSSSSQVLGQDVHPFLLTGYGVHSVPLHASSIRHGLKHGHGVLAPHLAALALAPRAAVMVCTEEWAG